MKKILKYLLILILLVSVTACSNSNKELKDNEKFKEEYESLNNKYTKVSINKNNPVVYITDEEVINKIESKSVFILLLGNSKDEDTRKIITPLLSSAKKNNINYIYYLDTSKYKDLSTIQKKLGEKEKLKTPNVVAISKGKIVESSNGISNGKVSEKSFNCVFDCIEKESTTCEKNSC